VEGSALAPPSSDPGSSPPSDPPLSTVAVMKRSAGRVNMRLFMTLLARGWPVTLAATGGLFGEDLSTAHQPGAIFLLSPGLQLGSGNALPVRVAAGQRGLIPQPGRLQTPLRGGEGARVLHSGAPRLDHRIPVTAARTATAHLPETLIVPADLRTARSLPTGVQVPVLFEHLPRLSTRTRLVEDPLRGEP